MSITISDCEKILANMSMAEQITFLARLGHSFTVRAREAYEFQGPGVINARLLRDFNEIHHRIYSQIAYASLGKENFPSKALTAWITGEGRSDTFRAACLSEFEQCNNKA